MKGTANLIKILGEAIDGGKNAAFVTVISADGSTPRETGAKMLVFESGSIEGTVGGGALEALAIKQAVDCIKKGASGKFVFDLKPKGNTGMICMGRVEIFIDVYKNPLKLLILGAGHVGIGAATLGIDVVKVGKRCRNLRTDHCHHDRSRCPSGRGANPYSR